MLIIISNLIASILTAIGAIVIIVGSIAATYKYLTAGLFSRKKENKREIFEKLRVEFGQQIILGLEFFLAGDIIKTIVTPSWDGLGRLAVIVAIRTILSYFLGKETKNK